MGPVRRLMPDGKRLHLHHGPSDLVILAEGETDQAYDAAAARFDTIIAELVAELPMLREQALPQQPLPNGTVARRMHGAAQAVAHHGFVTPMAAVAGAIADEVLAAMVAAADLTRAYVNNGGDIALHLAPGHTFTSMISGHDGTDLGRISLAASDAVGGIATSGRHGRSLSMGIADSVTVLAKSAALADVSATLVANAVDLPGSPVVTRQKAADLVDDSDLGSRLVVTNCGRLTPDACQNALSLGRARAETFRKETLISAAGLFLQGHSATIGGRCIHDDSKRMLNA